jgi:hypothetical protein
MAEAWIDQLETFATNGVEAALRVVSNLVPPFFKSTSRAGKLST